MLRRVALGFRDWLQHRHLAWHLSALAMGVCASALWLGWQTDDHIHRAALTRQPQFEELARSPAELFTFFRGDEQANRRAVALGHQPWWADEGLRLAFFRPVAGLTHWLDYRLWPLSPWLMHLHSLVWFGAAVAAAAFLYRRMFPSAGVAGLAALLFAVDDAHGMPAVWLANRNATLGAFFGLLALIAHDRWRRDGRRTGAVLAPLALLLGLLSNEGVVACGGYLAAYALFLDRGTRLGRLRSLAPCAVIVAVWWLAYKAGGYGAAGSGVYIDPGSSPGPFVRAVVARAPLLLCGQWAFASDLHLLMSPQVARVMWLAAWGLLAVLAAALFPLVRRDSVARFWTVGMLLAVLPACATFPSDRLLFFVGVGGMGLLAQFVAAVLGRADWLPARAGWRLPARALCAVLLFVHLVAAPLALTQAAGTVRVFGDVLARAAGSLPSDPAVRSQTVVIVNTPTYFVSLFGPLIQALNGKPFPAHTLVLGSGVTPIEVRRIDEHTLVVRPEGCFLAAPGSLRPGDGSDPPAFDVRYMLPLFDRLFRGDRPMKVGQRIELMGAIVEITAITEDGRPAEAAFRFATALEDPSLRWLQWENGVYAPFVLPAVGEGLRLPAVTVPLREKRD